MSVVDINWEYKAVKELQFRGRNPILDSLKSIFSIWRNKFLHEKGIEEESLAFLLRSSILISNDFHPQVYQLIVEPNAR